MGASQNQPMQQDFSFSSSTVVQGGGDVLLSSDLTCGVESFIFFLDGDGGGVLSTDSDCVTGTFVFLLDSDGGGGGGVSSPSVLDC